MSELRIEVGRATVIAEAFERGRVSGDGVEPLYSVADLLNATVRCLRAIGTEEAAHYLDLLTADDEEVEHLVADNPTGEDRPGTIDGVRVPFSAAPSGYVWLSPEHLQQAAAAYVGGDLPSVVTLNLTTRSRVGVVLERDGRTLNPRDYVVDRMHLIGEGLVIPDGEPPASVVAILHPLPLPDYR